MIVAPLKLATLATSGVVVVPEPLPELLPDPLPEPPVPLDVHVGDAADGVSVRVSTFENLRYVLKRATDLHGTFVPINANGAEKVGTGGQVMLIDASLDRPQDRAFYRIAVTLP